jgi:hypothetical protein
MSKEDLKIDDSAVATVDQSTVVDVDFVDGLLTTSRVFCSIKADTPERQMQVANAMNNPTGRISDKINDVILIKDLYLETLKMTNDDGIESLVPRIVLFDADGNSWQAVSVGLYSALSKLIMVYGKPTWETPIPVKIKQITRKERKMLTLEVVSVKK